MALNQVGLERLGTQVSKKIGASKNLIINGAMQVAQRGTSSTSNGHQTVDRYNMNSSGHDEAPTQAQADVVAGTTPYTSGFRKSLKITNGNQTSGAGAADRLRILYIIEAQDIANSGWNYTDSNSKITLSFWIKSSVAQNFYFRATTSDGTSQNFPMETGSLSADTWTKITKTIPGNSNLAFNNDNGIGLYIIFSLFRGTDNTDPGVALNTWAATSSGTTLYPDNTSTWWTTNDSTWELTGLQLEVGSVATEFEHRSFGEELTRCMRYFEKLVCHSYPMAPAGNNGINSETRIPYKVHKRAAPTVTKDGDLTLTLNGVNSANTNHSLGGGNTTAALYGIHIFAVITGANYTSSTMVNNCTFLCNCEL